MHLRPPQNPIRKRMAFAIVLAAAFLLAAVTLGACAGPTPTPTPPPPTPAPATPTPPPPPTQPPQQAEPTPQNAVLVIVPDEQRSEWSAHIPDEYAKAEPPFDLKDPNVVVQGELLYREKGCANCHGEKGDGDGPLSAGLNPKPVDFTDAALMARLSDNYLFWRISEGGSTPPFVSAMPAWKDALSEEERWQLVAYLRSLAVGAPSQPSSQVALSIMQQYGCLGCHRYGGQGNHVGPDLDDIGARHDADYIRTSILDPAAVIVEGYADLMPKDYGDIISEEDLNTLVEALARSTGAGQVAQATPQAEEQPGGGPEAEGGLPFSLARLEQVEIDGETAFMPVNEYNIFVNYELGMHCVGFDMNYCCVIPPYNSIQAQAVRSATIEDPNPKLLSPEDGVALRYGVDDNTYSEGDKMAYWSVPKDVNGDGDKNDPNDNLANYVWTHLYIYEDLEGTLPEDRTPEDRLHVGLEIPVQVDHGPSGAAMEGFATYAGEKGGNIVFTESRYGALADIPLVLTASYIWDALGLPLTAFNDSRLAGRSHRTITEQDFQPYQVSRVTLYDAKTEKPILSKGKEVSFIGTNPVDIPNCVWCHSSKRANEFGEDKFTRYLDEYNYWKNTYPDVSEYMARLAAASISILEIHDAKEGTNFLAEYDPNASTNRLGTNGAVNCSDCHGDNVQGRLKVEGETPENQATPLTEAIHQVHLQVAPDPDAYGRTQSCQMCHPSHFQDPTFNETGTTFSPLTQDGEPRFSDADVRQGGGGCYLRRDVHTNPDAKPPFFLNAVGEYLLENVAIVDGELRGLYCTNCHNHNAQALYKTDNLITPQNPGEGETLRNKSLKEIAKAIAGLEDVDAYAAYYLDPKVDTEGNPLVAYYAEHEPAALPEVGEGVTYADASAGEDWWLAASEPHCADCHVAPFVESMGGGYFPIDQQGKYSLYRYSKAHANIACQSCHESIHGLYGAYPDGADQTTINQALQFSPDGEYTGPVTCAACHIVNANGVPIQLKDTDYADDYYASVVLMHAMRGNDYELTLQELLTKYPYESFAKPIVEASMP